MTVLSVNVNKIALLRNSRGRDYPNLSEYVDQLVGLGVAGITVHPRPDERHVTRKDVYTLTQLLKSHPQVEFNIEGYPSNDFIEMVLEVKPAQCTLVPDLPGQLTSDHGWDVDKSETLLDAVLTRLRNGGVRTSLFLDPVVENVDKVARVGADRIELYTEKYASEFGSANEQECLQSYADTAARARELGIGLNAGHDLDLRNLPTFLTIPGIQEVSIGHALVVESLQLGLVAVVKRYLDICADAAGSG